MEPPRQLSSQLQRERRVRREEGRRIPDDPNRGCLAGDHVGRPRDPEKRADLTDKGTRNRDVGKPVAIDLDPKGTIDQDRNDRVVGCVLLEQPFTLVEPKLGQTLGEGQG